MTFAFIECRGGDAKAGTEEMLDFVKRTAQSVRRAGSAANSR
jgi:hypothetical protein